MKRLHKNFLPSIRSLSWMQWIMVVIVIAAGCLRFWKLPSSTLFLGDQGRDALLVSSIFLNGHLPAIGPITSVGNMYLGPLYYYFMAPFLFLSYPSPLGPVYAIAMIGTLTVFFLYYIGRKLVGEKAAVFAAFLCAFSVVLINFSRYSWNPNPVPLVSLFMMLSTVLALQKSPRYWSWVGVCFAILFQLHYITLLAGGAAGCIWLWQMWQSFKKHDKKKVVQLWTSAGIAALIFLLSLTPLVLFDFKHDFLNFHSVQKLLTNQDSFTTASSKLSSVLMTLRETHGIGMHVFFEFLIGKNRWLNTVLLVGVVSFFVWVIGKKKDKTHQLPLTVLSIYVLVGILGLSTYRNSVFDHYIAFLFPAVFLLLGYILAQIWEKQMIGKVLVVAALVGFLGYNIPQYSFKASGPSLQLLETVSRSIHYRVAQDESYGILLLTGTKDYLGMNYRYFLSTDPRKTPVDPSLQNTADTLFIIDEEKTGEPPEDSTLVERTAFAGTTVTERYEIPNGPTITVVK